jgi:hypothetical protein
MKMPITTVFRRKALALLFSAASLAGVGHLNAQNAVSNFGQGISGSGFVGNAGGSPARRTFSFTTGASVGGYDFSSITIPFINATGSPGTLFVDLYSTFTPSSGSSPTGLVANLSLSSGNPASAGSAVFSGSATLAATTTYFLLLSAPSATTIDNSFNYRTPGTLNEDGGGLAGWTIGDAGYISLNGGAWTDGGGNMMSIQASAIPEPSTYAAIAGAAMLGLAIWRRRRALSA